MTIVFSYPQYAPPHAFTEDGQAGFTLSVKPELWRHRAFVFLWTTCLLGYIVTNVWVEPYLEEGAVDEPIERKGCGPFNRNADDNAFGLAYGEGFDMSESHSVEQLGFNHVCALWDYSPSREVTALYFPLFEYSFVVYTFLDFVLHMVSYQKGELPEWYWKIIKVTTPIVVVFVLWFRMMFVATTYDNPLLHATSLVGLQVALFFSATTNVTYIWLTGQSYPTLGLSARQTGLYAKIFLQFNAIVTVLKMKGTLRDSLWIFCNAFVPWVISIVRKNSEDPLSVAVTAPAHVYDAATKPSTDAPLDDDDSKSSGESTPLVGATTGGTEGGSIGVSKPSAAASGGKDVEDPVKTPAVTKPPADAAATPAVAKPQEPEPAPEAEQEPEPVVDPKIVLGQAALDGVKGTPTLNSGLSEIYNDVGHKACEIWLQDGAWISDIFLPSGCPEGSTLIVHCNSTWNTNVKNLKPHDRIVATKQRVELKVVNGNWTEMAWVDEKGVLVIKGQEELNRHKGTDGKYFLIVANGAVVHHSADIEDNKKYLMTKYGSGASRPSRMIAEVSGGKVAEDPHTVGGQNQGGGVNAGFNKWWLNWNDIHKMTAVAKQYLAQNKNIVQPPKNDNLLHAFNVKDYKDVEIQTWDGSWIREVILPKPDAILVNSTLKVKCGSTWAVKVTNPGKWTKTVNSKQTLALKVTGDGGGKKDWK